MYTTCLHCHGRLGRNELIEHFPIGRRLAFDPAKGRLWIVCTKCRRWNLTPLEERWEAIEECDRLYAATRLRASTDNIGLARLKDGMEVVRIGAPKVPEMAAWRYARDFSRRWATRGLPIALAGGGGAVAMNLTMSVANPLGLSVLMGVTGIIFVTRWRRVRARIMLPTGKVVSLGASLLSKSRLTATYDGGWGVHVCSFFTSDLLTGPRAVHGLRSIMTARNFGGAPRDDVDAAITHLADAGHPDRFIRRLALASERTGIRDFPPDIGMALEMALNEDTERRALEGELALLKDEWELAEEIAGIADDLLLPADVRNRLRTLRETRSE